MKKDNEQLKELYKSTIRASYFNHMGANKFTQKSRIQVQQMEQQQHVDQNTFRIKRDYKAPQLHSVLTIRHEGFISPQVGGGFFSCFGRKQYQAQLKNTILSIYQNQKLKLYFDFNVINCKIQDKKDRFQIKIQRSDKKFQFFPINNSNSSDWVQALNQSINNSDGKSQPYQQIYKIPQFYKNRYISHKEFELQANTGDIIFFRSQHSSARLQQIFLNSQYDHVALVLRNKKNQLFLFESSSFQGVGLTEWKYMIRYQWYKSTQKMAWKKLNYKLQNRHFDIIQSFIAKTLGKEFQITLDKVFSFQSKLQRKKEDQQKKTYFCSQLIARLYKQLGFLDPNVSCTQYYPVTFSDSGNVKFVDSRIKLDKQLLIAF